MVNYNQPIFRKDWYIEALKRGPKYLFRRIKNDFKWAYQRIQRGYSDYDVSDIDVWFEYIMPGIIKTFKEKNGETYCLATKDSYKYYLDVLKEFNISKEDYESWNIDAIPEEKLKRVHDKLCKHWKDTLDEMIYLFTEMNKDECSKSEELKDDELDKYCEEKRKEAFEMFNKYFHCLWY